MMWLLCSKCGAGVVHHRDIQDGAGYCCLCWTLEGHSLSSLYCDFCRRMLESLGLTEATRHGADKVLQEERLRRQAEHREREEKRRQEAWDALVDRKKLLELIRGYGGALCEAGIYTGFPHQLGLYRQAEMLLAEIKGMLGIKE